MSPAETSNCLDDHVVNKGKAVSKKDVVAPGKSLGSEKVLNNVHIGKPVVVSAMVASRDKVISISTSLNKENHVVVQIDKLGVSPPYMISQGVFPPKLVLLLVPKVGPEGFCVVKCVFFDIKTGSIQGRDCETGRRGGYFKG
ncbi:hypothetical protein V6N13_123678 [Hibiscus sabdariffa]